MTWKEQPSKIAHRIECLRRDTDSRFIGYVIQFNTKEIVHAWSEHERLGSAEGVGAAKDIVEEIMEKVK